MAIISSHSSTRLDFSLIESEQFLINTPWPIIMAIIAIIAWLGSKNIKIVSSVIIILILIGYFDMWENTMKTISITFVAAFLAIVIGIPIGILMAKSNLFQRIMNPVLDVMQTMPSFVYLIPVVMLLGIGKIPGLIAVVVYSIPPMIRLTNLGIRLVNKAVIEAADSYGASNTQKLIYIQIPLCAANNYGWNKSDNNACIINGGYCINDWSDWSWSTSTVTGNSEPVLYAWYI